MPSRRQKPNSDKTAAEIMTCVSVEPGKYLKIDLARKLPHNESTTYLEIAKLVSREWIGNARAPGEPIAYSPLAPMPKFWTTYNRTIAIAHSLDSSLIPVFEDAIAACRSLRQLERSAPEFVPASLAFLGGAALLGQEFDLNPITDGEWFAGEPGWRSIIEIQSSQIPA